MVLSKTSEFLMQFLVIIQIVFMTWACSGTNVEFMFPMFLVSVLMFIISTFLCDNSDVAFEKILRCVLYVSIIICTIQYFNPYMERINGERFIKFVKLPYIEWLPKSVKSEFYIGNPMRMLAELVTVFTSSLAFLHTFKNKNFFLFALAFFVFNTTAMGVLGVWQKFEEIPIMYGLFYATTEFFGSFFMANAAGAFLNIGLAVSLSLFICAVKANGWKCLFSLSFLLSGLLCSYASYISESTGAFVFTILTWIISFTGIILLTLWQNTPHRLVIFCCVVLLAITSFAIWRTNLTYDEYIQDIVEKKHSSILGRLKMYELSFDIIKENPLFGTGGASCQYVLSSQMVNTAKIKKGGMFVTEYHAHSDILEYIIDFGLIGLIAIVICFVSWFMLYFKYNISYESIPLFVGILLSIIHSCFDMNLHILSSMLAFSLIVCASLSFNTTKEEKKC